jgi:hypothetical protein
MYSKKKIGIGKSGSGAFLFITPRVGEDFDDDLRYTAQLMKCAPEMYEMLDSLLRNSSLNANFPEEVERIESLLAKARGEV